MVAKLASYATDDILKKKTPEQMLSNRHYYNVTNDNVWAWIMQRLQLSLDVKLNIEDAYKSVLFRPTINFS